MADGLSCRCSPSSNSGSSDNSSVLCLEANLDFQCLWKTLDELALND